MSEMSSSFGGFEMDFGIPAHPSSVFASIAMDGDEYVRCSRCGHGGCDVRVAGCGCTLHARCMALNSSGPLTSCPQCHKATDGLVLFPMSFREIDDAHKSAKSLPSSLKNRGRKRKAEGSEDHGMYISERRTGRWTTEEMAYCDKLIEKFESGEIPVEEDTKLNEFLGNMLKSKQSRLTKKMKNAKLSSRLFKRTTGHLTAEEGRMLSELEEAFFHGIQDLQERAEIRFHMQKEWREQFSHVCAAIGQPLDADAWLNSVEEMDRRASQAKNAARVAKRKIMMGVALRTDAKNPDQGVFIEKTEAETRAVALKDDKALEAEFFPMMGEEAADLCSVEFSDKGSLLRSAPFLAKVTSYLQRHLVPFEHVDLWVPSFVPGDGNNDDGMTACRLCYAGSATVEKLVIEDGKTVRPCTQEELFNFFAFGDYSQKFSFDVGCGLPGRVYESGRPTWEQSVQNAPHQHFERCGGACQWGVKTVVGLPIASPNVGRIVVTLYSCFDRAKDEDLVARLSEEFTKLMPSPKWKLVVDIGDGEEVAPSLPISNTLTNDVHLDQSEPEIKDAGDLSLLAGLNTPSVPATAALPYDNRISEVIGLLGEFTPSDPNSPHMPYLSGFMTLRLLLLRQTRTLEEEEFVRTMLDSFSSYTAGGRERADIAVMLARDCMFLSQQLQTQQHQPFLGLGPSAMNGAQNMPTTGLSLFGLPSTSSSLQNSPALTPIPVPGNIDSMSIVSN